MNYSIIFIHAQKNVSDCSRLEPQSRTSLRAPKCSLHIFNGIHFCFHEQSCLWSWRTSFCGVWELVVVEDQWLWCSISLSGLSSLTLYPCNAAASSHGNKDAAHQRRKTIVTDPPLWGPPGSNTLWRWGRWQHYFCCIFHSAKHPKSIEPLRCILICPSGYIPNFNPFTE